MLLDMESYALVLSRDEIWRREREKERGRERARNELRVQFQAQLHNRSENTVFCIITSSFYHGTIGLTDFRLLSPDNCTNILRKCAKPSRCWYRRFHVSDSGSARISIKEPEQNKIPSREKKKE